MQTAAPGHVRVPGNIGQAKIPIVMGSALTSSHAQSIKKRVTGLARKFSGQSSNPILLEYARMAAEAELERVRFEQAKVDSIHAVIALSQLKTPRYSASQLRQVQRVLARNCDLMSIPLPKPWPDSEPERLTEAIRRALPELVKLESYARRAAGRRERALRIVCAGRDSAVNL